MGLAVDKLNEELALRIGELLHARSIGGLDFLLHQLHVLLACLIVGQRLHILIGLDDDLVTLLGDRQHFLDIV